MYKFRVCFLLASTFMLCQCTKTVTASEPVAAPLQAKPQKKVVNPYSLPTAAYIAMAKKQDSAQKQSALISAAGRLISEGQWRQGSAMLTQTADLTAIQLSEKNLLLAKIDLMKGKPEDALSKLSTITDEKPLDLYHQIQFHELLAQSYRATNEHVDSVAERIKLDSLLPDNTSQNHNRKALWLTLINLPEKKLNELYVRANQSELQGWLQLALLARKHHSDSNSLLTALEQWQSQYKDHTANRLLPTPLGSIAAKMLNPPKQIALLLPLSGPLAEPGKAIREGFMAAYKANNGKATTEIKTYDTAKGDVATIYQQAITEGANYVVGPLTKNQVTTIASIEHPIPTLLLNDSDVNVKENSYSFGLSPTNEAMQVAIKANSKGYNRALIITPKNAWGVDVSNAFIKQWQKKGGQIVDTYSYGPKDDMNKKMSYFLQVSNSQARGKQLKLLLGDHIQTSTSRRQDFDMIFLLAYPSKARQIMPLLNYYYAGDVPVFATSSVYAGNANPLKDKDLDGLIFCDIPWVFSHQMGNKNWPEQFNSYNRLYALGKDSYALATQLNQLLLFPADGSMEDSGTLYLKSSQQVARVLEWGQFKQGLAHSLGGTV